MKKENILLLLASTSASFILLAAFLRLAPNGHHRLTEYSREELIRSHGGRYSADEINSLRESFSTQFVFNEVLFEEPEVSGKYVNKSGKGYRHTFLDANCKNTTPEKTVWVFGGSTTYGYGVEDSQTVPSHISRLLNAQEKGWCVRNYGRGFFNSSQELLQYTKLLATAGTTPQYVIFIDGLNDHDHLLSSLFVPEYASGIDASLIQAINSTFHNRFTRRLFGSTLLPVRAKKIQPDSCIDNPEGKECSVHVNNASRRMLKNWEVAGRIAKAYNSDFIPVLQPVPTYRNFTKNPFAEGHKRLLLTAAGYKYIKNELFKQPHIYELLKKTPLFIDASNEFATPHPNCELDYVDPVHYSECGGLRIARLIADRIYQNHRR